MIVKDYLLDERTHLVQAMLDNPPVNHNWNLGPPPPGEAWKLKAFRSIWVADATGTARTFAFALSGLNGIGGGDNWSVSLGQVITAAGQACELSGGIGVETKIEPFNQEGVTNVGQLGLPDVWFAAPVFFGVVAFGTGAGDQASSIFATYERRLLLN